MTKPAKPASKTRRTLIEALDRSRFTDEEWAQVLAGICVWQTGYEPFGSPAQNYCPKSAPDDHTLCDEHQREARDSYGYTGP